MPLLAIVVEAATLETMVYDPVLSTVLIGYAPLMNRFPIATGVLK